MTKETNIKKATAVFSAIFLATILLTSIHVMAPAAYGQGGRPQTTGPPCPPGSEFEVTNGIGRCVSDQPPQPCPPPSEVNLETGLCEAPAIERCPSDAPYNPQTGKCEAPAIERCPSDAPYNPQTGKCGESLEPLQCQSPYTENGSQCIFIPTNACPTNTTYQEGRCISQEPAVTCPSGYFLDPRRLICLSNNTVNSPAECPNFQAIPDSQGQLRCFVQAPPPMCMPPTPLYDPILNRCFASAQSFCQPPSILDFNTGQCKAPPIERCPSDAPYNPQTEKCGEGSEPLQCQPPYQESTDGSQCIRSTEPRQCQSPYVESPDGSQCIRSTEPRQCQSPYVESPDGSQCVFPSNNPCPEGSKIDTSTNQCIYNANRCPQGFNPETSTTGIQQCRQQTI